MKEWIIYLTIYYEKEINKIGATMLFTFIVTFASVRYLCIGGERNAQLSAGTAHYEIVSNKMVFVRGCVETNVEGK